MFKKLLNNILYKFGYSPLILPDMKIEYCTHDFVEVTSNVESAHTLCGDKFRRVRSQLIQSLANELDKSNLITIREIPKYSIGDTKIYRIEASIKVMLKRR